MKNIRWFAALAAVVLVAPMLVPTSVDARVGGGGSTGSRGSKTDSAPAPTQTAPSTKPVERTATPQTAPKPATAAPAPAAGGFMSRNPFLSGMMGGMLGAGLIGMMFGGGFGGGLGGMSGMLGLLIQLALIGGLAYLAVRLWKGRSAATASAATASAAGGASPYAFAANNVRTTDVRSTDMRSTDVPLTGGSAPLLVGNATAPVTVTEADYKSFETLLADVQAAFSKGDLSKLRTLVTPEMLGYFSEQLSADASRGVQNKVDAVKLEQGDLSEAWSEAGLDYATVAMRFSMIDVTHRLSDGTVVDGSDTARTEATEVWTFLRSHGGTWILSAIQQA